MSATLKIYHRLPPTARNAVASLRGYYLNWWRYDRQTDKLVEEALERDTWGPEEWKVWQEERLSALLERAATQVPFYRSLWKERRRKGDRSSWTELENWPVLEKEDLRKHGPEFVADDRKRSKMFHDHTSGTTGTALDIWLSKNTVREWYALFEARCRRWYGLSRNDRWAILGGQLVTPSTQTDPPFWIWNSGLNQLYMSSYHISPETVPAYVGALKKYRVRYLLGYPSAIFALAQECVRKGIKDLSLDVVVTNAEPVYDHQREIIGEAFGCPVRETYGMAEIAAAASECEIGNLHQWPDAGIIESSNESGIGSYDFICTGLINSDMPLIRYRVGDSGRLSHESCDCGRGLPLIETIEGRSDDVLFTRDGRRVGRMDPVFKGNLPIREAQIVQKSLKKVEVRFVPAEGLRERDLDELADRIRERMGDIEVICEEVQRIPRTDRGKFRAVVCELPDDEMALVEKAGDHRSR